VLGGVAGGIGRYLNVDPVLIRLFWILFFFAGGSGLVAYILAWIIVPEEPIGSGQVSTYDAGPPSDTGNSDLQPDRPRDEKEITPELKLKRQRVAGVVLMVIGAVFLLDRIQPYMRLGILWPIVVIGAGVYLLTRRG